MARHIVSGIHEKTNVEQLAIELHGAYVGVGHRTEIIYRLESDPAVPGWRGVATFVLERQNTLNALHDQLPGAEKEPRGKAVPYRFKHFPWEEPPLAVVRYQLALDYA